jgi:hypothetical protein
MLLVLSKSRSKRRLWNWSRQEGKHLFLGSGEKACSILLQESTDLLRCYLKGLISFYRRITGQCFKVLKQSPDLFSK